MPGLATTRSLLFPFMHQGIRNWFIGADRFLISIGRQYKLIYHDTVFFRYQCEVDYALLQVQRAWLTLVISTIVRQIQCSAPYVPSPPSTQAPAPHPSIFSKNLLLHPEDHRVRAPEVVGAIRWNPHLILNCVIGYFGAFRCGWYA